MTSRDFVYWLQGYFEIEGTEHSLDLNKVKCIKRHLAMVFKHEIDPSMGSPEHQAELDQIHEPEVFPHPPHGPIIRC